MFIFLLFLRWDVNYSPPKAMTFLSEPGVYLTRLSCAIVVLLLDIVGSRLYERFLPAAPSLAPARRVFFVAILAIQTLLYTVDATVFVVVSVSNYELPATLPSFSECFLFFAVLLQFSSFFEQEETPHWGLHVLGWLLLFAAECLICVFRAVTSRGLCVFQFTCGLGLALAVVKGLLWLALGSLFLLQWLRDGYEKCPTDDEAATESATNPPNEDDDDDQGEPGIDVVGIRRPAAKELKEAGGWWNFVKRYQMFLGFIWPKGRGMQRRFIACVFGVMIESYLAYLVPLQFATFMDSLGAGVSSYIWTAFMWLRILHLATSDAGLVFPRNLMWMSVSQHRHLGLNTAAHDKMMNLDAFLQSVISSAIKIQAVDSAKPITSIIDDVFFEMLPHAVKLVCASVTVHHRFGPQMTLIMLCTTFLLALSQLRVLPILAKRYDETLAKFYKANQRRHDDIKGWPTVDNHDRVKEETELYKNEREEHRDQYLTYTTAFYYLRGGNGLVVQIFETLAQALVIYQIQKGIATGGDMVAFAGLWPFIYEPLRFFTSFFNDKVETIFGATPLRRIWEVEKEIGDGTEVLACPKGKIEVRDMEFSFPKSSCKIFNGFNIIIPAGAKVGIFGGSGCGKSTLAALLMRRFQIQSGSILVDDQDISKVTSASYVPSLAPQQIPTLN